MKIIQDVVQDPLALHLRSPTGSEHQNAGRATSSGSGGAGQPASPGFQEGAELWNAEPEGPSTTTTESEPSAQKRPAQTTPAQTTPASTTPAPLTQRDTPKKETTNAKDGWDDEW